MIRVAVRAVALVLVLAVVAGFGYERLARAGDAERYPPPGERVAVDGHRLHLLCSGAGGTTVVLEAGLGEATLSWATVQRRLATTTRVCSYDRAGLAWSEPAADAPTAMRSAEELRTLLAAAGELGPYVLVGHSIGATIVRLFADAYPTDVAGIVLIDPTNENAVIEAGDPALPIIERRVQGLLAELGVMRLLGRSLVADAVGGTPPPEVLGAVPPLRAEQPRRHGPRVGGLGGEREAGTRDGAARRVGRAIGRSHLGGRQHARGPRPSCCASRAEHSRPTYRR